MSYSIAQHVVGETFFGKEESILPVSEFEE